MRANHTPHLRAVRMRRIRRRSYLADGVISIYCIKVIPPPDNDRCSWCGCPTEPGEHCEICGNYHAFGQLYKAPEPTAEQWAASISPPSPPWPAPEPEEICTFEGCTNVSRPGYLWCEEHLQQVQDKIDLLNYRPNWPAPGGAA